MSRSIRGEKGVRIFMGRRWLTAHLRVVSGTVSGK